MEKRWPNEVVKISKNLGIEIELISIFKNQRRSARTDFLAAIFEFLQEIRGRREKPRFSMTRHRDLSQMSDEIWNI